MRLGADALEIDVRRTRDGAVVVFHDEETTRLTGQAGTIEARTLAEVRALDAGFSFTPDGGATFPFRGAGLTVPTLAELLARHPAMRLNIDAKTDDEPLARALAEVLLAAGAGRPRLRRLLPRRAGRAARASSSPAAPATSPSGPPPATSWRRRRARTARAAPSGYQLASLPHRMGDLVVVDEPVVAYFHARGMPVHVWTVDDAAEMRELLRLGVDGIVTDRPDLLKAVLGR